MTLICGIDEAGRGPVIGPLVICGVLIDEKHDSKLKDIGARDSKLLTPRQREEIEENIKKTVKKYKLIVIESKEVDKAVESEETNLNWLEADKIAEIINYLNPNIAYVDCPSNNIKAYTNYLEERVKGKTKIIAEHKADMKFPTVSAASIIAKVERDSLIEKLKKKHNVQFGSGYPSDPITVRFLEKNYKKYNFFRKSWATWKTVAKAKGQSKLGEF
ncbi:ribonuclease HII [Candidatus Woesearchaeota archaeon]|nr:ribonuclease HII [Candidatus Woesearchaeota archaeon]